MSSEWFDKLLGDVVTLKRGYDLPAKERKAGNVPIISSSGFSDTHEESKVSGPGVVTGRYGTIGEVFYSEKAFWPLNTTLYVEDFKGNHPKFIYYLLKTIDYHRYSDKAAVPGVNRNHLHTARVHVPDLGTQISIARVLGAFDDRIDLLRQTNTTLEAIAQAIFKSWFVDFDPVKAKAEGLEPVGMDAATAELFPSEFEESELGAIPKGWQVKSVKELLSSTIGGDWGQEEPDAEHTLPATIIRGTDIPDIKGCRFDSAPRRYVRPSKAKSRTLQDGDIVIEVSGGSKTQSTGRAIQLTNTLLQNLGETVLPASFCRLFRPIDRETGLLLSLHLTSIYQAGKMWNYQVQSTGLANFQTQHFLESELVVCPPATVLKAAFEIIRPLIERQHAAPIQTLAQLRDTLLPRLISGKLRLPEAQEELEEALA